MSCSLGISIITIPFSPLSLLLLLDSWNSPYLFQVKFYRLILDKVYYKITTFLILCQEFTPPHTSGNKTRNQERTFRQWQLREGDVLYRSSVQQLSNTHLLAHLLRDEGLAERLMESFGGLNQIAEASIAELKQISGVGTATAERIQAAFELSRRLIDSVSEYRPRIGSPIEVYMLVCAGYQGQKQEILKALLLNTQKRVLKIETIFIGTLNFSVMHPLL